MASCPAAAGIALLHTDVLVCSAFQCLCHVQSFKCRALLCSWSCDHHCQQSDLPPPTYEVGARLGVRGCNDRSPCKAHSEAQALGLPPLPPLPWCTSERLQGKATRFFLPILTQTPSSNCGVSTGTAIVSVRSVAWHSLGHCGMCKAPEAISCSTAVQPRPHIFSPPPPPHAQ